MLSILSPTVLYAYVGCYTEESYNQFPQAAVTSNYKEVEILFTTSSMPLDDKQYTIIKKGMSTGQIRLEDGLVLWIPSEATR